MTKEELHAGMRVHYAPAYGKKENGIVKSITEHAVFVVYNCGGNWEDYKNYTAANTHSRDLRPGWTEQPIPPINYGGDSHDA